MLVELHIENFAIIEHLDVNFAPGLITLTGETGAGKSIIIDAVETLLGGRAESIQVRSGKERASIDAVFQIPANSQNIIQTILDHEGLSEGSDYLTLSREVRLNGRNIARVNGRSVSTGLLREIGEFLIDVHGQSEHLSLLHVNQHLGLLDRYTSLLPNNPLQSQAQEYKQVYAQLNKVKQELEKLREAEKEAARRIDMLTFQTNEIAAAGLHPNEEEELQKERNRLANAESLTRLAQEALQVLDEGSPDAPSVTELFGQIVGSLSNLTRLDPTQQELDEIANLVFENMTDLARNLRHYLDKIEFNSGRLDQLEERLALIRLLKRKYGDSIPAILAFAEEARGQLDQITHVEEHLSELEQEQKRLVTLLEDLGTRLSETRTLGALQLEKGIESELADLKMSGARFKVHFHQTPNQKDEESLDNKQTTFYATGIDKIEFLIAPNPGEGFKPLAKIASGGETSRLMLALKNVLAQADHVPTLIFDEIDQGIGGKVGVIVGQKLLELSRQHQVLCITHLPQLAAFGEQHFHVEKEIQEGRTVTVLKPLTKDARIEELAQMLGGVSQATLQSARELLQTAQPL